MKLIPVICALLFGSLSLSAQTLYAPSGTVGTSTTANVGVGTSTPAASLQVTGYSSVDGFTNVIAKIGSGGAIVFGSITGNTAYIGTNTASANGLRLYTNGSTASPVLQLTNTGNVGIGTTAPAAKLHVKGDALASTAGAVTTLLTLQNANANQNYLNVIQIRNSAGGNWNTATTRIQQVTDTASQGYIDFNPSGSTYGLAFGSNAGEVVRLLSNGNVGIGTSAPDAKLAVNGTIHAKEVIVDTSSAAWSDYVFAPDYRLAPLSEVERHIKAEQHLPGIPSAAEVAERGISVGEMQAKLLAKVEELTLHVIEQQKQIAAQTARIERLESETATHHGQN